MAFRVKALALLLVLALSACGPAPVEPTPAQAEAPQGRLYYIGSTADPLSELLFDRLEDWAQKENWAFVSYDCRGVEVTQAGQLDDVAGKEPPGVAVLYPVGKQSIQDEGVEQLYRAGFAVVTLNRPAGSYAKRYVSCHIGLAEEDVLPTAARMVNDALGRRNARYVRLSDYWPDLQADALSQALFPAYHVGHVDYTSGWRVNGQAVMESYIAQEEEAQAPPSDFVFAMSQATALGGLDAMEKVSAWADVPVFALRGDLTGVEEVAYGRLAGVVCISPRELTERLVDVLPQVARDKPLRPQELAPRAITAANARDFLKEYEN